MTLKLTNSTAESLSIILPAYGEADNLRLLLPEIQRVVNSLTSESEILVIDAASPLDNTLQVCQAAGVKYLPRSGGNNYGDAIRTGIGACINNYVVIMDADGSHKPEFIRELWKKRELAEIVIASRYVSGGQTDNPWMLVTMSWILNLVFKVVVGLPVLDISNSFRLYRGDILRNLKLGFSHFDVLEEILVKVIWENPQSAVRLLEIPYHFEQRKYGKSKRNLMVFGFRFLIALYRLYKVRRHSERLLSTIERQ